MAVPRLEGQKAMGSRICYFWINMEKLDKFFGGEFLILKD